MLSSGKCHEFIGQPPSEPPLCQAPSKTPGKEMEDAVSASKELQVWRERRWPPWLSRAEGRRPTQEGDAGGEGTGTASRSYKWFGIGRALSDGAACWYLPTACRRVRVGSWHQHPFFWSCWLREPRGGTPHGSLLTVCFLGNLYHLRATCSKEMSGCRADISTPPSCLSPPCFISKQHIRGWCLANRGAQ